MRHIEGYLEGYGPGVQHLGGMKYDWVRIRKKDGKVENIQSIVAYPNVAAQMDYILTSGGDKEQSHVILHAGKAFIYALDNCGTLHSDYPFIKSIWIVSIFKCFTLLVVSILMFMTKEKAMMLWGFLIFMAGILMFMQNFGGLVLFWPSFAAGRLKSVTQPHVGADKAA